MRDHNCPICRGSKRVWYGVNSDLLPAPIPCRCCRGTGRRLWEHDLTPEEKRRLELQMDWGKIGGQQSRRNGPTRQTIVAITCCRYEQYVEACTEAGWRPVTANSWARLRCVYKDHPARTATRRGPK